MKRASCLWLVLSCLIASCSFLSEPEALALCSLTPNKPDPCPTAQACVEGRCQAVPCLALELCGDQRDNDCDGKIDEQNAPESEICGDRLDNDCDDKIDEVPNPNNPEFCGNGVDDDCDGNIDEGHDKDMDGVAWCGDTSSVGGGAEADCDDYDPSAAPGMPEVCDGRDNDCDSRIDETSESKLCPTGLECIGQRCEAPDCTLNGGSQCPDGQRCDRDARRCVPIGCTKDTCPQGQYCDQLSGECRIQRRPVGEECVANGDCASGSCIEARALRIRFDGTHLCGKACCTDADCSSAERCYASGSGARSCLPLSLAPYPPNSPRPCFAEAQCSRRETCAVIEDAQLRAPAVPERNDLVSTACQVPRSDAIGFGKGCSSNQMCASQVCVPGAGLYPPSVCSRACGTSDDCEDLKDAEGFLALYPRGYCRFVSRGASQDYVPVCVLNRGEAGSGTFGQTCANGSSCLDGACVGAAGEKPGICSMTCCRDADCPPLSDAATFCRPVTFGEHFEMRCMP